MINDLVKNYMQTPIGTVLGGTHYMMTNTFKDDPTGNTGTVVCFKSASGSPIDTFPFDVIAIYMGSTEFDKQGWTDPTAVKIHTDIVILSPRDIGSVNAGIANYSSSRRIQFEKGKLEFAANHNPTYTVGQDVTCFRGIFNVDFSGDVKVRECAIVDYYWQYPLNRETYWFAKGLGQVKWEHAVLKNNVYVPDNISVFNIIKKGPVPVLNYPIGNILGNGK